jgi:hypothetical protein
MRCNAAGAVDAAVAVNVVLCVAYPQGDLAAVGLKAATESEAARFSQAVDAKAVDAMKQFAFYYDGVPYDAGFHPDQFTRADVVRIFTMCHRAVRKSRTIRL